LQKLTKIAGAGQEFLVSYNMVIKLESGGITNPSIDTLQKLAKALNVSVDDLLK
jgi:transcriptional regulator with XRE-family HTH domain